MLLIQRLILFLKIYFILILLFKMRNLFNSRICYSFTGCMLYGEQLLLFWFNFAIKLKFSNSWTDFGFQMLSSSRCLLTGAQVDLSLAQLSGWTLTMFPSMLWVMKDLKALLSKKQSCQSPKMWGNKYSSLKETASWQPPLSNGVVVCCLYRPVYFA